MRIKYAHYEYKSENVITITSNDVAALFKYYSHALKKKSNHRLERSNVHAAVNITSALFRLKTLLYEINIIIKCDGAYYSDYANTTILK